MIPVIIPHYRKPEQLARCMEHLRQQTVPVEVFVRDNNADNVYFTAAVNEGIRKYLGADCRYMIVLNQDMYLEPGAVGAMVQTLDTHPKAGIGWPLEHVSDQPEGQVLAGGLEAFPFGVHRTGPRSQFAFDEQILWANGSCMMLRTEMIREIGLLDESFRFICSDSDYCFTARSRGWQVWRVGAAYGVHEHGASAACPDLAIEMMKIDDMLTFARKWLTGGLYRQLGHEGSRLTHQAVAEVMTQYKDVRDRLLAQVQAPAAPPATARPAPASHPAPACPGPVVPDQVVATLRAAARLHQAGDLDQAERLYHNVLAQRPNQSLALHSLGLIAFQRGRLDQAEEFVTEAVCSDPTSPHQYHTLGILFDTLGQPDRAVNAFQEAIRLKPDYTEARRNLAAVLCSQGRPDLAVPQLEAVLGLEPGVAEDHLLLADLLKQQGRPAEAVDHYKKALNLQPELAEACNNLATTLRSLGRIDEAIRYQRRTLELRPEAAEFHANLAAMLQDRGRLEEAIALCRRALELAPDRAEGYTNLGSVLRDDGRLDEAIACNGEAIRRSPDSVAAHWNQAICLLLAGRLEEGWKELPWRRKVNYAACYPHTHTWPLWDGSDLRGRRLFIHCEQGLGDALQFARYLPMVKERGGTVVLGVWKPLGRLLSRIRGVDELVELSWQQPPVMEADLQASLMDLPGIFGTTMETIPCITPYVFADPDKARQARIGLASSSLKVGLVWAGSPSHSHDPQRSCPLGLFEALTGLRDVTIYSLQKDLPAPQDRPTLERLGIIDLSKGLEDLADTAAVIDGMDLIISVDTAVLHLAGAMARPVWGLIPYSPDWRWMLRREDSPWYPTLRLFRQDRPGDWQTVIGRVAQELERRSAGRPIEGISLLDGRSRVRAVRRRKGCAGMQAGEVSHHY